MPSFLPLILYVRDLVSDPCKLALYPPAAKQSRNRHDRHSEELRRGHRLPTINRLNRSTAAAENSLMNSMTHSSSTRIFCGLPRRLQLSAAILAASGEECGYVQLILLVRLPI